MKLHDEAISQIAKILQVAILTGTDVVDNLRMLDLTRNSGVLKLTNTYKTQFESNISKMIDNAQTLSLSSKTRLED
jgi:hypothetical protein